MALLYSQTSHGAIISLSRPLEIVSLLFKDLRGMVEAVPWILFDY